MKDLVKTWKGFDTKPAGCLLEQVIDESPGMGIAYERSCDFYKGFHVHDRIIIVFPRASCEMEVRTKQPTSKFKIDSNSFLSVPPGVLHDDEGLTAIYDTMALLPEMDFLLEVAKKENVSSKILKDIQTNSKKLKRSTWLDQLVQHYFFERVIAKKPQSEELQFLERNILSEIFKIASGFKNTDSEEQKLQELSPIGRALKFIETNLFSNLESEAIAKHSGTSLATLFRQFNREMGLTPYAYIKRRRLEEAMRLIKTGRQSVGEVAMLVGYDNFGAFTDAFKCKYRKPPSKYLPKKHVRT